MNKIFSLPKFEKQFKKFSNKDRTNIQLEIKKIAKEPLIGEQKKGILKSIRVYKWKLKNQLYLLAYEFVKKEKIIYLYAVATHEGFYKELERYRKNLS